MTFVPDEQKSFPFEDGDLVLRKRDIGWGVAKIIKVFKIYVKKGEKFKVAGRELTAPEDDFFVAVAWIQSSFFDTREQAIEAAKSGTAGFGVNAVARGVSFFPDKYTKIGSEPVKDKELKWYEHWIEKWNAKEYQIG